MSKELIVNQDSTILELRINRPENRNALTVNLISLLTNEFLRASKNDSIRCIFLTSTGEEAFCAGADLKELTASKTLPERLDFFSNLAKLLEAMSNNSKPIVCKVHGYALAGGLGLVASSDIVLASEDSKFALPELNIGMVPMVVMAPLERILNKRNLSYLALTCEQIDAQEALRIGLVSKVYPKNSLDEKARETALLLSKKGPLSIKATRETIYEDNTETYQKTLRERALKIAALSLSSETQEGINAFLEKRPAKWAR
jgi:enoyl-CoA hydratase/carnithine racemase